MSSIDVYSYTCIGEIVCPTPYRIFHGQKNIRPVLIGIYYLEQNIPEHEDDFQGMFGDILVGGGSGEAPAMLIRMPDAVIRYTKFENIEEMEHFEDKHKTIFDHTPYETYWSPTATYILGAGYETLGWNPEKYRLDKWLNDHVLAFLVENYPTYFEPKAGYLVVKQDGSICRKLSDEDDKMWNWKKYQYGLDRHI